MTKQVGNLPAEVSSFVGRRPKVAELKRLLKDSRLVTVTGVGGVGKTRVALRVAGELKRAFSDGVWWVELSTLTSANLLAETVSEALGIRDRTSRPQVDALIDHLAGRQLLLVMDTCEHVVDACAELVVLLLRAAPGLRVLATSRQSLGVFGERIFVVPPLRVPGPGGGAVAGYGDVVNEFHAVTLFVERAQELDADFDLRPDNVVAVAQLCDRLDGIPLAIELAVPWLRSLSVRQMLELVDAQFKAPFGPARARPPRHETMRTAIGWSFALCSPVERLLWARASVFTGDFDLDATCAVCADERLSADAMLGVVAGLIEKSVLLLDGQLAQPRYRFLDTVREFGLDVLRQSGAEPAQRRRHRDYYLALAGRFDQQWCGPDQVAWARRMNPEHTNVRAALDFCLSDPAEHAAGLQLIMALRYFWMCCGSLREGRHYLNRAIALDWPPGPALTKLLWVTAWVALAQGDIAAVETLGARCLPYAEEQGDITAVASLLHVAAWVATFRGDTAGRMALAQRAAALHRHGGDPGLGLLASLTQQCMALAAAGDDRAVEVSDELRAECDRYGERWYRAYADYSRALVEVVRGDAVGTAAAYARDALRFERQVHDTMGIAMTLDVLAESAVTAGDAERAARLHGIADRLWRTISVPQEDRGRLGPARQEEPARRARSLIGDDAYESAFAAGSALDLDAAVGYALGEQANSHPRQPPDAGPLTQRERQVADLVAEGLTNPQIAARLTISLRTAESHVEHIRSKLGFATRAQVATWVTERRGAGAALSR